MSVPDALVIDGAGAPPSYKRHIHLLYVPTLCCNLSCSYCYLGEQTSQARLKDDAARAVSTLRHALAAFEAAGVLPFNVSLHGGEVTTLPEDVLDELFLVIRDHYRQRFDAINALGHRKSSPHIKTNLYRFAPLVDLFRKHRVSISASIDLPLTLHARHRVTRGGKPWLEQTLDNLRLLAAYPHAKKISATLGAEHLEDIPALIADIRYLHHELGFDMNQFNLMFAFPSALNREAKGAAALQPATEARQLALHRALHEAFAGTDLDEGLRRHWFDEFTPSYCTNAVNCGERFFLLQGDGNVYSCVRGQGLEEFHYGNIFTDPVDAILDNGRRQIAAIHQAHGFDAECRACGHLHLCHTGCPVVKHQTGSGRSYTCGLQRALYAAAPRSYPFTAAPEQAGIANDYAREMHPALAFAAAAPATPSADVVLPGDLYQDKNALAALIGADPLLQALFSDDAFVLQINDEMIPLASQILKPRADWHTLGGSDRLILHVRRETMAAACPEPIRNTLYLQMLRDTPVVYGDEARSKQEHLFTYQLHARCLDASDRLGADWLMADIGGIVALHRHLYQRGVRNNLLLTTLALRDYHYQKQKSNAFYHIQAINLPFQNIEFFYLP